MAEAVEDAPVDGPLEVPAGPEPARRTCAAPTGRGRIGRREPAALGFELRDDVVQLRLVARDRRETTLGLRCIALDATQARETLLLELAVAPLFARALLARLDDVLLEPHQA